MSSRADVRFSDDLMAKVEAESVRKEVTISEVIRLAVEEYFQRDQQRQMLELMLYETMRTYSAVLRRLDMIDPKGELSDTLLAELTEASREDAASYMKQRKST